MSSHRRTPVEPESITPRMCSLDLRLHILKGLPFFAGLPAEDIARMDRLVEAGWRVIRVTKSEVFRDPARLIERIRRAVGAPIRGAASSTASRRASVSRSAGVSRQARFWRRRSRRFWWALQISTPHSTMHHET